MKKLVLSVASSILALMLTSCGEQTPKQPEPTTEQTQPADEAPQADKADTTADENKAADTTAADEDKAAADNQTQE